MTELPDQPDEVVRTLVGVSAVSIRSGQRSVDSTGGGLKVVRRDSWSSWHPRSGPTATCVRVLFDTPRNPVKTRRHYPLQYNRTPYYSQSTLQLSKFSNIEPFCAVCCAGALKCHGATLASEWSVCWFVYAWGLGALGKVRDLQEPIGREQERVW